ncbi:hypothetical protein AVEN_258120-1 [Araneus ventricosus]|uniref:Uncharacterized protein n=1 Tax=Araneus ventricosus TaxID=182803 RepID=A0A4Y2WCP1_ARAVE|nr:hypothetical protein AVEN_258120-1 [Araneus ventricosus]
MLMQHVVENPFHLEFFPENRGSGSDEHGERFRQDISNMGARYQGKWNPKMLADNCWTLKIDIPQAKHSRQASIQESEVLSVNEISTEVTSGSGLP